MYNNYMTYLFFSSDPERISNYLKKFLNGIYGEGEDRNVTTFNAQDTPIDEVLDECLQLSLSFDKKVIICDNLTYLKQKSKYSRTKESRIVKANKYDNLVHYIENDTDENVILVFTLETDEIDLNNPVVSKIPEGNRKSLQPIKDDEWPIYVSKYFQKHGLSITNDAVKEVCARSKNSLSIFLNEAQKVLLYCDEKITLDDIKTIFTKPEEDDIFTLTSALLNNDKNKALETFRSLRVVQNIEPVVLISIMANSLIFLDNVSYLRNEGFNMDEIANKLKVKRGKIYYAFKELKEIKPTQIKKALTKLYELDKAIKHSEIDRFYNFELFILNF